MNAIATNTRNVRIEGDVHSNSQVDLGGSQMYIAGELRYRGKYTNKVSSSTGEDGLNQITAAEPYPIEPPWLNDYAAVRAAYPRATVVDNIILNASTVYPPRPVFCRRTRDD